MECRYVEAAEPVDITAVTFMQQYTTMGRKKRVYYRYQKLFFSARPLVDLNPKNANRRLDDMITYDSDRYLAVFSIYLSLCNR